jgi:endonuclease-3 related protein
MILDSQPPQWIDFKSIFILLREWFDVPIPSTTNFHQWRRELNDRIGKGQLTNLPLKTWWPKYSAGDFRFELCIGILLVHQVTWRQVTTCFRNILAHLERNKMPFTPEGLLSIPVDDLADLIRASRFAQQKAKRIRKFCDFLRQYQSLDAFFHELPANELDDILLKSKSGFGKESRDTVLLYAVNSPVFIADAYSRKLLTLLDVADAANYATCQKIFQDGIQRDFDTDDLSDILNSYSRDELDYVLINRPPRQLVPKILLYQMYHAEIVELGISKRWDEFLRAYKDIRSDPVDPQHPVILSPRSSRDHGKTG